MMGLGLGTEEPLIVFAPHNILLYLLSSVGRRLFA